MRNQVVTAFQPAESKKAIGSYRKEKSFWAEHALIDLDKGQSVANVRFYGAGSVVYCVAWFHLYPYGIEGTCRGAGKASGYGYHKPSAAMGEALADAGVTLAERIEAVGDTAMESALLAIAAHLQIARPMIHKSHA